MEILLNPQIVEIAKARFHPWHCEVEFQDRGNLIRFKLLTENSYLFNVGGDLFTRRLRNLGELDKKINRIKIEVARRMKRKLN
jgi:hypothetical protein